MRYNKVYNTGTMRWGRMAYIPVAETKRDEVVLEINKVVYAPLRLGIASLPLSPALIVLGGLVELCASKEQHDNPAIVRSEPCCKRSLSEMEDDNERMRNWTK